MNKIWSIVLIVVACIVVLGGTYWYFGVQKMKAPEDSAVSSVAEPAKAQPSVAMDSPSSPKSGQPLQKKAAGTKQAPLTAANEKTVEENLPAEAPKMRALPSPIAPTITKGGGFALPLFGDKGEEEIAAKDTPTSVLAREALPPREAVSTLPTLEEEKPEPLIEGQMQQEDQPVIASSESIQEEETPEELTFAEEKPLSALAKEEQKTTTTVAPPPAVKILRSETAVEEETSKDDKASIDTSLSVSFLDYNSSKDFTSKQKSFTVSLDVMSQKEMFGWGGTLEFAKIDDVTNKIQISLLAKAAWNLGKGVVTFPLSISLGPTLFIDSDLNTPEFGMKARLGAGATYAISESFRIFYAIGVGATYNFQDSSSFRFVLEPIRVGVGFSF